MKKLILLICFALIFVSTTFSQRIIFESDFENITLNSDSLPNNWQKFDLDAINPAIGWAIRDTSVNFGGNTRPRAIGTKSLEIPWYAGNGGNFINNDFVFTDTFTVRTGDSLIFWMLIGSDSTFQPYLDTMQVGYAPFPEPSLYTRIITYKSNDSAGIPLNNNVWTRHVISLNFLSGQQISLCFRYYMNVSSDGLWCNIDNVFIGNHSAIGIRPISTEIPKRFNLKQNYPNPFNPTTNIEFDIAKTESVKLIIYNSLGQEVQTLVNQNITPGTYRVDFNANNLASGTYFYRLIAGSFVQTNRMVIVK